MSAAGVLRLGLVGAGHMGRFHAEKIGARAAAEGDVRLEVVVDVESERARALADASGARAASELAAGLEGVDAIVVAVPTVAHAPVVEAALDAGLDVLVEKPIAATVREAEALLAAAQARRCVLQVGHLEWFNAAMRTVASSIRGPRFVEAHRLGPFPARATDVDVVRDLMIHDLDIVQRLVGEEPERVEAIGVPVITDRVDIANARLVFPGGCVANLTASRVSPNPMRKLRFFQPDGYFSIDFLEQSVSIAERTAPDARGERQIRMRRLEIDRGDALAEQLRAFVEAVRTRKVAAGGGDDGLAALRTALRVVEAMPPLELR
ncbi:MAG: Gfo/Idh/MocA family oxidoreductase [Myxococcota bacterium]|nr:Gfo/Idh/MocA family oxidoreductase [Myxococcota bacterium]